MILYKKNKSFVSHSAATLLHLLILPVRGSRRVRDIDLPEDVMMSGKRREEEGVNKQCSNFW